MAQEGRQPRAQYSTRTAPSQPEIRPPQRRSHFVSGFQIATRRQGGQPDLPPDFILPPLYAPPSRLCASSTLRSTLRGYGGAAVVSSQEAQRLPEVGPRGGGRPPQARVRVDAGKLTVYPDGVNGGRSVWVCGLAARALLSCLRSERHPSPNAIESSVVSPLKGRTKRHGSSTPQLVYDFE